MHLAIARRQANPFDARSQCVHSAFTSTVDLTRIDHMLADGYQTGAVTDWFRRGSRICGETANGGIHARDN
jgi:hypothetical protein